MQIGDRRGQQTGLAICNFIADLDEGVYLTQGELGESFNLLFWCLWRLPGGNGLGKGVSKANAGAWRLFFPLIGKDGNQAWKSALTAVLLTVMRMTGSVLLAALRSSNDALIRQGITDSFKKHNSLQDYAEQL